LQHALRSNNLGNRLRAILLMTLSLGAVTSCANCTSSTGPQQSACANGCPAGTFCDPAGFCAPLDGGTDGGRSDAGHVDAGPQDSGPGDAGPSDAGPADGGNVCVNDGGPVDAGPIFCPADAGPLTAPDAGTLTNWCATPGSWVHDCAGWHVIGTDPAGQANINKYPGAWLNIPVGFCAHHYASVPNARQLRFAPGGELFVASPTNGTTGGGPGGMAAIAVVPDDNHDGVGDSVLTYKSNLGSTQGMLFTPGFFYYQDTQTAASAADAGICQTASGTAIYRESYSPGQRQTTGNAQQVMDVTYYCDSLHWPKTLDISDDGTIYVGNGGDQSEVCTQPGNTAASMPAHGGIVQMTPGTNSAGCTDCEPIVKGLRNPIAVKCHHDGNNHCFATELALDYSAAEGGREKLLPIHSGDNWGFPCCASASLPYLNVTVPCAGNPSMMCPPDCSTVMAEDNSFVIGNTPFGFDFDDWQFPAPWDHHVIVALHGAAGTWAGAKVVAIATDPCTGLTLSSTNTNGSNMGAMVDFATGWDDGTFLHGRPADIEFAPDGRMFVANDTNGEIFWIYPITR
jgi:glucose/arabinose dehydrogenase